MSEKDDISRRKILSATGGLSSAIIGIPAVGSGHTTSSLSDANELTQEEVKQALAKIDSRPSIIDKGVNRRKNIASADNLRTYVGVHKDASTPTGKPFAIESFEDYLSRESPPGFTSNLGEESSIDTRDISTSIPSFYLKENVATVSLAGHSVDVGAGMGIKIKGTGIGLTIDASIDIYVGGVSFSIYSFSIGYGVNGKQVCASNIGLSYSVLPDLVLDLCGIFSVDGSTFSGGLAITLCVNPCDPLNCKYCKKVSGTLSQDISDYL